MRERSSPKADAITRSPAAGRKNLSIRHKNFQVKNEDGQQWNFCIRESDAMLDTE